MPPLAVSAGAFVRLRVLYFSCEIALEILLYHVVGIKPSDSIANFEPRSPRPSASCARGAAW
jgi:hypothetical protein